MRTSRNVVAYHTKAGLALTLLKEHQARRIPARGSVVALDSGAAVRDEPHGGVLSGSSHKTLRVLDVTAEDVREIYMVRSALEEFATEVALPRLAVADMNHLEESIEKMATACQRGQSRNPRRGIPHVLIP